MGPNAVNLLLYKELVISNQNLIFFQRDTIYFPDCMHFAARLDQCSAFPVKHIGKEWMKAGVEETIRA